MASAGPQQRPGHRAENAAARGAQRLRRFLQRRAHRGQRAVQDHERDRRERQQLRERHARQTVDPARAGDAERRVEPARDEARPAEQDDQRQRDHERRRDDRQDRHHLEQSGVALPAALHHQREHEPEERRQHADDHREQRRVDRDAAARAAAKAVDRPDVGREESLRGEPGREVALRVQDCGQQRLADREEDEQQQQRGDHDDDRGDRGIAAEQAPPRDRARQADGQREERQRRADAERGAAVAGGETGADSPRHRQCRGGGGPRVATPCGEYQRGDGRRDERPQQRLTGERPQQRRRAARRRPGHGSERGERDGGDDRSRAIARHRHENGPRERGRGRCHSAREPAHLGSVETSLSHLVSRRVRSAEDPYFAKS